MKINEIKPVLSAQRVLEATGPQALDLVFESTAEMLRQLRTSYASNKTPAEHFGQDWTDERVAQFCASLEKIERVITKQIAAKTLQTNLRDAVYSVLISSDFDHDKAIEKIVRQSHDQEERVKFWIDLLASEDTQKIEAELNRVSRDISALVAFMRTHGAQTVPGTKPGEMPKAAPGAEPNPML